MPISPPGGSGTPTGPAGGALAGTYPNPSLAGAVLTSPIGDLYYATLNGGFTAAVALAAAVSGTVVITDAQTISAPAIVPANVGVRFEKGGSLVLNNTSTIAAPAAPTLTESGSGAVPFGLYYAKLTYTNATGETAAGADASITIGTPMAPPAAPAPTTLTTGGTILAGTYSIAITYVNPAGETAWSSGANITTTGSTSTITIPSPVASGNATNWYAYVLNAQTNLWYRQQAAGSPTALGTSLTLTAPPTTTGATAPTVSTAWTTHVLTAPAAPVPTTVTTGGTIPAGVYGVIITYLNPSGETTGSVAGTVTTTGSTSTITISSPAASGNATNWNAYVTQVGGSVYTYQAQTAIGTALTLTARPTSSGVTPPLTSTASTASLGITSPATLTGATNWYAYVAPVGVYASQAGTRQQLTGAPTLIGTNLTLTTITNTGPLAPPLNTTAALQLLGPVQAPLTQIFSGSGVVLFGAQSTERYLPQWWGAVGDTRQTFDAVVTSGSPIVFSATANFTSADVGKVLTVGGTTPSVLGPGWPIAIIGTVLSVQDAQHCTASTNALASITSAGPLAIGTDSTVGFQQAVSVASLAGGGTVWGSGGMYFFTDQGTNNTHSFGGQSNGTVYCVLLQANVKIDLSDGCTIILPPFYNIGNARSVFCGVDGCNNWSVEGGAFIGQAVYGGAEEPDWPVFSRGCTDWHVANCTFSQWSGKAVMVIPSVGALAKRFRIEKNHMYLSNSNVFGINYGLDWTVENNFAHDTSGLSGAESMIVNTCQDGHIVGNRFFNWGTIFVTGTNMRVERNVVTLTPYGSTPQHCCAIGNLLTGNPTIPNQRSANIVVTNNVFDCSPRTDCVASYIYGYLDKCTITQNDYIGRIIVTSSASGAATATGVVLDDNTVTAFSGMSGDIYSIGAPNLTITNNVCESIGQNTNLAGMVISGNRCGGIAVGDDGIVQTNICLGVNDGNGSAITLLGNRALVSGNVCSNTNANGMYYPLIRISGGTYNKVSNNVLTYPGASVHHPYISEVGAADYNVIENNELNGAESVMPYDLSNIIGPHSTYRNNTWNLPSITQPGVPLSGTTYTNNLAVDCTVYISGGTVTVIAVNGVTTGLTSGGFVVRVGQTITLTYSVAPTWEWVSQ